MENAMERLASGSRINSSRDDAAGLAISGRMESQISGLNQSVRNANDGIALAQSAEGALDETTSILQRMRDLSVQASSDTLTAGDRTSIQSEMTALTSEIDRISSTTTFNNKNLLDGTATNLNFQVGISAGQSVSLSVTGASATDLGLTAGSSSSTSVPVEGLRMTTLASVFADSISINGENWAIDSAPTTAVGASLSVTNAAGATVQAKTSTAQGVAAIINEGTSIHGAVATGSNLQLSGVIALDQTTLTDAALTIGGGLIDVSSNMAEFVTNINAQAGAGIQARIVDDTHIELYNSTGADIVIGGTDTNSGFTAGTTIGHVALTNADGTDTNITVGPNSAATTANSVNALGFNARTAASTIEGSGISGLAAGKLLAADDLTLNGISIAPSTSTATNASAATLAAHFNTSTAATGVTATASTSVVMTMDTTDVAGVINGTNGANDTMIVNGVTVTFDTITDTIANLATDLNDALADSGIRATVDGNEITLTSALGDSISITDTSANVSVHTKADGSSVTAATTELIFTGHLTFNNASGGDVKFGTVGGTDTELAATLAKLGLQTQGATSSVATAGEALSVTTSESAAKAITAIDAALEKVFASRGDLGAFQNRLDHTVSNLRNVSENTSFSRSQIQDTDFATESANLAKAQVLQQAGTAMLAQANASGQSVLSLLK
jgi:flagellin